MAKTHAVAMQTIKSFRVKNLMLTSKPSYKLWCMRDWKNPQFNHPRYMPVLKPKE
jgi:hypothetical protein